MLERFFISASRIWIASHAYLADDSVNIESALNMIAVNMIAVSFRDDCEVVPEIRTGG